MFILQQMLKNLFWSQWL